MSNCRISYQAADWKNEKHVPLIEAPSSVKAGEKFQVKIQVGKEIDHPNTTEHHISWLSLFFKPENEKYTYNLGNYDLESHWASTKGTNEGPVASEPEISSTLSLKTSGTLLSSSYCNIHGLWESSKEISVK